MKVPMFHFRLHRKACIAGLLLAGAVTPSLAQFGFSIVQDPTEIAQTINNLKQSIQIALSTKQTLTTMQANLTHFSLKSYWQTLGSGSVPQVNVSDSNGETAGWDTALNTNSLAAANTAWNMANVQVQPGTVMAGEVAGSSSYLSSMATIEAFDASSPNCLNAVGQYRAQRASNATAEANLETNQLDGSAATNSEVEQLNLLNASDAQHMTEIQSQGQLHACLVEQTTIANMNQRNVTAEAINDAAVVQQQHAANDVEFAGESNTWQTYIP